MSARRIAIACTLAAIAALGTPALAPPCSAAQERARPRSEGAPIEERAIAPAPEPGTCFLPAGTSFDDAIAARVRAQIGSIAHCWERCLRCPPREGRLVLAIEVRDRGRAERVRIVEQTFEDPALASCVASTIARMPMPLPPRGIAFGAVQLPLVFVRDLASARTGGAP